MKSMSNSIIAHYRLERINYVDGIFELAIFVIAILVFVVINVVAMLVAFPAF